MPSKKSAKPVARKSTPAKKVAAKSKAPATKAKTVKAQPVATPRASSARPVAIPLPPLAPAGPTPLLGMPLSRKNLLLLVTSYLWRSLFLATTWGLIATFVPPALISINPNFQSAGWQIIGNVTDILVSLCLSIFIMHWLVTSPVLHKRMRLQVRNSSYSPAITAAWLWLSFTWRSLLWMSLGALGWFATLAVVTMLSLNLSNPKISLYILVSMGVLLTSYLVVAVPYLVWLQLLKKRTFRFGNLELSSVQVYNKPHADNKNQRA